MEVKKAVIPAAGLGVRFHPITKAQPKEMLPIIDTPVIHYVVKEALDSGIDDIIIVTGKEKRAIEDYLEAMDFDVHYIRQKKPMGLGHAIGRAEKHIGNENFAVLLGDTIVVSDVPCTKQLMQEKSMCIAVEEVGKDDYCKYGMVGVMGDMWIKELVEKPINGRSPSNLGAIGRYTMIPDLFDAIKQTKPDAKGEIQLTDALRTLVKKHPIKAVKVEGKRYDIGDKGSYVKATMDFARKRGMELWKL